jgi:hypothetical protein
MCPHHKIEKKKRKKSWLQNTGYIIFKNQILVFQIQNFMKKIMESSRIFYLSKWEFQTYLIIWQTSIEATEVLQ